MNILTSEAAQQIEDALKLAIRTSYSEHNNIKFEAAIAAIREQKAELEKQEPVAIVKENPFCPEGRSDELNVYLPVGTKLYAAPVEPVKQEPVAWEHFGIPSVNGKQAEKEPLMDYERINALREGEQNGAEDAYFFVRPENDTPTLRKMFCQGFERGFHKGLKYASHVRTKDMTDDDKAEIECALNMAHNLLCWPVDSIAEMYCFGMGDCDEVRQQLNDARAVIAADREKNK